MKRLLLLFIPLLLCSTDRMTERGTLLCSIKNKKAQIFFNKYYPQAVSINKEYGIPKALFLAEMALVTDMGSKEPPYLGDYIGRKMACCIQEQHPVCVNNWLESIIICGQESKKYIQSIKRLIKKYNLDILSDESKNKKYNLLA